MSYATGEWHRPLLFAENGCSGYCRSYLTDGTMPVVRLDTLREKLQSRDFNLQRVSKD